MLIAKKAVAAPEIDGFRHSHGVLIGRKRKLRHGSTAHSRTGNGTTTRQSGRKMGQSSAHPAPPNSLPIHERGGRTTAAPPYP
jgi:hypothetical protein